LEPTPKIEGSTPRLTLMGDSLRMISIQVFINKRTPIVAANFPSASLYFTVGYVDNSHLGNVSSSPLMTLPSRRMLSLAAWPRGSSAAALAALAAE
jgi:hypothetical protein